MAGPFTLTGAINGVNATYAIANPVSNDQVYVSGLRLGPTDYTLTNTTTTCTIVITAASAIPQTGDEVLVYGDPYTAALASASTLSRLGFSTAGTIINRCAVQCGLSSVSDPYASTDQNFVQLRELLNMVGEDLNSKHEWSHFVREATITTASSSTSYVLPSDFHEFVDNSQWNRSTRLPMVGPLSGQDVQFLKARLSGVLIRTAFRLQGNVITFPIAPSDAQTLAWEYLSTYWVWSANGTAPDSASATATGDTVLYDAELAIAALRLAFLDAKGFDTVSAQRRYDDVLEHSIGKNVGSRILDVGGITINPDHLIDADNLPVTGYG